MFGNRNEPFPADMAAGVLDMNALKLFVNVYLDIDDYTGDEFMMKTLFRNVEEKLSDTEISDEDGPDTVVETANEESNPWRTLLLAADTVRGILL